MYNMNIRLDYYYLYHTTIIMYKVNKDEVDKERLLFGLLYDFISIFQYKMKSLLKTK